jgi:hypothetical protein
MGTIRAQAAEDSCNDCFREIYAAVLNGRLWPRLCENAHAPFSGVNFSHVEAISDDSSHRIRLLAILLVLVGRPYFLNFRS